jgi:hypothetical protein
MNMTLETAAASIPVKLRFDFHLADCDLAKRCGPDATLACADCGRAMWMHATRHDTCRSFCWVTEDTITDEQICELAAIAGAPEQLRETCRKAVHRDDYGSDVVRDAKRICCNLINHMKKTVVETAQ